MNRSKEIQALREEIQRDPGLKVKRSKEIQAVREEIQRDPGRARRDLKRSRPCVKRSKENQDLRKDIQELARRDPKRFRLA